MVRMKQLKSCRIKKIKRSKEILSHFNTLSVKRGECYLNVVELDLARKTIEGDFFKVILNSIFMTKEQFGKKMESLKSASAKRFNNLTKYSEFEIESCLVNYVNNIEDI
jgi:hypothetical protein